MGINTGENLKEMNEWEGKGLSHGWAVVHEAQKDKRETQASLPSCQRDMRLSLRSGTQEEEEEVMGWVLNLCKQERPVGHTQWEVSDHAYHPVALPHVSIVGLVCLLPLTSSRQEELFNPKTSPSRCPQLAQDKQGSLIFPVFHLVQFSHSVVSDSLRPRGPQHARPPRPSPTPGVDSNSCPLSRWCYPTISSSVSHQSVANLEEISKGWSSSPLLERAETWTEKREILFCLYFNITHFQRDHCFRRTEYFLR